MVLLPGAKRAEGLAGLLEREDGGVSATMNCLRLYEVSTNSELLEQA